MGPVVMVSSSSTGWTHRHLDPLKADRKRREPFSFSGGSAKVRLSIHLDSRFKSCAGVCVNVRCLSRLWILLSREVYRTR